MQSFIKKALVVFAVAMLLLSAIIVPGITRADEQINPVASTTWQTDPSVLRTYNGQTGALNFISFPPDVRGNYNFKAFNRQDASDDLAAFATEFAIGDTPRTMSFVSSFTTNSGSTSYRYQQEHNGVPIYAGELLMNYDAKGQLAAISGETSPNLTLSTTPRQDSALAAQYAMQFVANNLNIPVSYLKVSTPELWIYDPSLVSPYTNPARLVWRMEITPITGQPVRELVLWDAQLGGVALAFNQVDTAWTNGAVDTSLVPNLPQPPTNPNPELPGFNATAITYNSNNTDNVNGTGASTFECQTIQPATVTLFGPGSCETPVTGSPASDANAAQYFALGMHDYFDFYFGRDSIDDNGMTIISNVLFTYGGLYDNAFWDGYVLTYGNDGFQPSDDVVGHELTHGVTQYSSNLQYYYESGAMNEAMSDIFGEYYDMLNGIHSQVINPDGIADPADPGNWLMGEDEGNGAFRNLANPPAMGQPDRMRSPSYFAPTHEDWWLCPADCGGVHYNSGVANKAAYLMAVGGTFNAQTITALGSNLENSIELAQQIWYDTEYILTSGSDYNVLDLALVTACNNLVGVTVPGTAETLTAADCTEVDQVTIATEMHLEPSATGYAPEATLGCTDGTDTINNLFFNDFESGTMTGFTAGNGSGLANKWTNTNNLLVDDGSGPYDGGPYAWSGTRALWSGDFIAAGATDNHVRLSAAVTLSGGVEYFLYFKHAFGHETTGGGPQRRDGAIIEYSTNGGGTWTNLSTLYVDGRNYNGAIASASNALNGLQAFTSDSHGYNSTRYNLTTLGGQNVMIRWHIANDGNGSADIGWLLDDVRIYRCVDGVTPTNTPIPPTNTNTPIPPTNTNTPVLPTSTNTPVGPTNTPVPPTSTNTPIPPTNTNTPVSGTATNTPCLLVATAPTLVSPVHRSHTADRTPTFTWSSVTNAQSYRLMVYLEDRSFEYKKRVFTTNYTLTTAESLTVNKYLWRVRTQDNTCSTWSSWSTRNTLFED